LFDQDQLPEMSPHTRAPQMHAPHGGARSASAAAATAALHHPHYGLGRHSAIPTARPTGSSAVHMQYHHPNTQGMPRAASTGHFPPSKVSNPRIHFYDHCNAIVEERDRHTQQTRASFRCGTLLGTGGFAKVFDFIDCRTGERWACKVIDKSKLSEPSKRAKLQAEIEVHRRMQHPNILRYIRAFEDEYYHYLLLERCCKMSLMELSRSRGTFQVEEAQFILWQLILGVEFLHSNRVIHRDLKLGNVMVDCDGVMKIGDFGFATELRSDDERKKTMCGTPNYIAPEILTADRSGSGYSYEADIWSLGVILYTLMVGVPPFETSNLQTTYSRIKRCEYSFPSSVRVPESCKDLVHWMLQLDPRNRPHLTQIRSHSFLFGCPRVAPFGLVGLDPELVPNRDGASPYAEAGRSSSPIQSQSDAGSPLQAHPVEVPIEGDRHHCGGAIAEFSPPPAFRDMQPTPYHFHGTPQATPQRTTPQATPSQQQQQQHHRTPQPQANYGGTVVASPLVARPLYTDPMGEANDHLHTMTIRMASLAVEKPAPQPHQPPVAAKEAEAADAMGLNTSAGTPDTEVGEPLAHFGTSSEVSTDAMEQNDASAAPPPENAPAPPRVFFTDLVHFPRYGYGFQLWDLRQSPSGHRTKATGAFLNDRSKLIRDVRDDTVWYFARVREESNTNTLPAPQQTVAARRPAPLAESDIGSARCFYDHLHQFIGGARVLDPKSSAYEPLSPFLQSQNVFKKYTIVKFIETHVSTAPWGDSQREVSHHVTSALNSFFLEPHQDIYSSRATLDTPLVGDAASQITFVKEAWITPITAILPPSHALGVELLSTASHRIPLMAAARFSDLSFQVSLSAPCPSSLQLMPQVVGIRGTPALSNWKLDAILYDTNKMSLVYRADDDVYALSMGNVALQKRRGFNNSVVFSATASYPREMSGILISETTLDLIVAMLRKVHCPDDLLASIVIA
jgi:serine/threonine protein kinase